MSGIHIHNTIIQYLHSEDKEYKFALVPSKEPKSTLLPMSEHLTKLKKQHPRNLVISIFHTFVGMCFMSQRRLISPTHCHRIIPCNKAQSQSPPK